MRALEEALPGGAAEATGTPVPVRRLLVMAAVAALLAVVALFTVLPRVLKPPVATPSGERVFRFDPKRVRRVEFITRDRVLHIFTRRNGTWTLAGPQGSVEVPADRLDGFLETLAGLTRLVVIDEPGTRLEDFGLAPPRAMVTIRDGRGFVFAIGDRNPPLTALYVQVLPSTNIELVGSVLLWEFDKLVALTKASR
jgi:Domain of unknown function (DUF4340)